MDFPVNLDHGNALVVEFTSRGILVDVNQSRLYAVAGQDIQGVVAQVTSRSRIENDFTILHCSGPDGAAIVERNLFRSHRHHMALFRDLQMLPLAKPENHCLHGQRHGSPEPA